MLISLLFAGALVAQTPAERSALLVWDDSLQQIESPSSLPRYQELAAQGSGPTRALRETLFRIRSATLRSHRADLSKALENALLDASQHPNWAWPHLALARAYFHLASEQITPLQTPGVQLGESLSDAGWHALYLAIKADANLAPARALALMSVVPGGDRELRAETRNALALMMAAKFPEPDLLLAWGRDLRRRGFFDSSLAAFNTATVTGGDPGRLALERAHILEALGDSASATAAYWSGLEKITPIGREAYRYDLAWILTADSLAAFDKVPDAQLRGWLGRFWAERDAAAANPAGARLLEQFRRWNYVLRNFRSFSPWRRTMFERVEMLNFDQAKPCLGRPPSDLYQGLGKQPAHQSDMRDREMLIDQRGVIYLRHGQPTASVGTPLIGEAKIALDDASSTEQTIAESLNNTNAPATSPLADRFGAEETDRKVRNNESWIYFIEGQWRMLNFVGSQAYGTYAATTLISYFPILRDAYYVRGQYMSSYADAVSDIDRYSFNLRFATPAARQNMQPLECYPRVTAVVKESRADAKVATTTDTDSPALNEPWAAVIKSFALGDAAEHNGKVLVTFAVAAKDLTRRTSGDGRYDYPINFRIVAYEGKTEQWVQVDTLQHLYANTQISNKGWVTGWFEVPVSSGLWQVSVLANQEKVTAGSYTLRRGLVVDSAQQLSLSDLITGRAGAAAWQAPDGKAFPLNPTGVWPEKAAMEVYYEVRGLKPNSSYRSTLQLRNAETSKVLVNLKASDQASGPLTSVRKTLGLTQVKPGKYVLAVTIEVDGRSVERTTAVVVEKR